METAGKEGSRGGCVSFPLNQPRKFLAGQTPDKQWDDGISVAVLKHTLNVRRGGPTLARGSKSSGLDGASKTLGKGVRL